MTLIYVRGDTLAADQLTAEEDSSNNRTTFELARKLHISPCRHFAYVTTGHTPTDMMEQMTGVFNELSILQARGSFQPNNGIRLSTSYLNSGSLDHINVILVCRAFSTFCQTQASDKDIIFHNITGRYAHAEGSGSTIALPMLLLKGIRDEKIFKMVSRVDPYVSSSYDSIKISSLRKFTPKQSAIQAHMKLYTGIKVG